MRWRWGAPRAAGGLRVRWVGLRRGRGTVVHGTNREPPENGGPLPARPNRSISACLPTSICSNRVHSSGKQRVGAFSCGTWACSSAVSACCSHSPPTATALVCGPSAQACNVQRGVWDSGSRAGTASCGVSRTPPPRDALTGPPPVRRASTGKRPRAAEDDTGECEEGELTEEPPRARSHVSPSAAVAPAGSAQSCAPPEFVHLADEDLDGDFRARVVRLSGRGGGGGTTVCDAASGAALYQLGRQLSRGGQAAVYEGVDKSAACVCDCV